MTRTGLVARVLIDSPLPQLDHLFDYSIPAEFAADATPGVRVKVPFRSAGRVADGYLIEVIDTDAPAPDGGTDEDFHGTLSPIDAVVSPVPVLTPEVWKLARRIADRSAGNASDVIRLACPPRQVRVEKAWLAARAAAADAPAPTGTDTGADTDTDTAHRHGHRTGARRRRACPGRPVP